MGMHCYLLPVCIENSNSDIVMMQSAENRVGVHTASSLNRARKRRILTQRTMRSPHIIIGGVVVENPAQVRFAYHGDMVEQWDLL
jgi:hypothetical protein